MEHKTSLIDKDLDKTLIPLWNNARKRFVTSEIAAKLMIAARKNPHISKLTAVKFTKDNLIDLHYEKYEDHIDLSQWIRKNKKLTLEETVKILTIISDAVITLHSLGIVHRDINPTNMLIDPNNPEPINTIKLNDLELAANTNIRNNDHSSGVGTPGFAPPEQSSIESILSARIDQFSLALTFANILSEGNFDPQILNPSLLRSELEDKLLPKYGKKVIKILMRSISEDPSKRYCSVSKFKYSLIRAITRHHYTEG